ncbi:MAG: hypothetical protein AAFV54_14290, partial [Pseudomonadota bacterium]
MTALIPVKRAGADDDRSSRRKLSRTCPLRGREPFDPADFPAIANTRMGRLRDPCTLSVLGWRSL